MLCPGIICDLAALYCMNFHTIENTHLDSYRFRLGHAVNAERMCIAAVLPVPRTSPILCEICFCLYVVLGGGKCVCTL